jgi:ubiquinone/menaquinone biosynthesis C-methylase UbiE
LLVLLIHHQTLGELVTGDRASYQYLVDSIRNFPPQQAFAQMIEAAGFAEVTFENLTGGVVCVHSGYKLPW